MSKGPEKKGWALPDEPKLQAKKKLKLQLGCKPASRVGPPEKLFIYIPPSPATVQVYSKFWDM